MLQLKFKHITIYTDSKEGSDAISSCFFFIKNLPASESKNQNKAAKMREEQKMLLKKEKMPVTSIFSFPHYVLKSFLSKVC